MADSEALSTLGQPTPKVNPNAILQEPNPSKATLRKIEHFYETCKGGDVEKVEALIRRYNVTLEIFRWMGTIHIGLFKMNPFIRMCFSKKFGIAKFLSEHYPLEMCDIAPCFRENAFVLACEYRNYEFLDYLLEKFGVPCKRILDEMVYKLSKPWQFSSEVFIRIIERCKYVVLYADFDRVNDTFDNICKQDDASMIYWMLDKFGAGLYESTLTRMFVAACQHNDISVLQDLAGRIKVTKKGLEWHLVDLFSKCKSATVMQWLFDKYDLRPEYRPTNDWIRLERINYVKDDIRENVTNFNNYLKKREEHIEIFRKLCYRGDLDMLKLFAKEFTILAYDVKRDSTRALDIACEGGSIAVTDYLIVHFRLRATNICARKSRAIRSAFKSRRIELVKHMLSMGYYRLDDLRKNEDMVEMQKTIPILSSEARAHHWVKLCYKFMYPKFIYPKLAAEENSVLAPLVQSE